ncbi:hypothetical protein [Cellulomonas endophytica]|uniref:hypothetical protein n=1 Tax=Cellulomonas endophytica TaxID=2494735 RepID=UPI00101323A2|nr:hypothetical protein [Cellulomonas endophytica]
MTDRDPVPPYDSSSPDSASGGTALRDRWWWSATLWLVLGLAVIGYQVEPLRGTNPLWANWLVAGLGLLVAAYGGVRLVRAARSR